MIGLLPSYLVPVGLALFFVGLWAVQRRTGNASWADAGWALAIGAVMLGAFVAGEGDPGRRALAAGLIGFWSLRLGTHLVRRSLSSSEDSRFADMRQRWGERAQRNFLRYYLAQVPLVLLFCLPALALAGDARPLGPRDAIGVGVGLTGLIGTAVADRQLARHRATAPDAVCRSGLWRFSRHPNYFFEWVTWCAWPLLAPATPTGALAAVPPAALYVLLTRVTGIPPAEQRSLARRGDAYRQYQEQTSAFFPGPTRVGRSLETAGSTARSMT
jgi:steroid 5-alpha reductase family enzyme